MNAAWRYAVTVPSPAGTHAPADVVMVERMDEAGPGGGPVYADVSGDFRVEIDGTVARVLSAPSSYPCHGCLAAEPRP